jgi:hypothetical protein
VVGNECGVCVRGGDVRDEGVGIQLQQAEQKNNRRSELKGKMRGCRSSNNANLIVESELRWVVRHVTVV